MNVNGTHITAATVVALLRRKHSEDLFVSECKDGPSQSSKHVRMDAWAMNRSWASPCVSAYEVKVTRGDFLGDNKWHAYLPCCNAFSFVCPRDVVRIDELPSEVGLYYVASTGGRLTTQRKPVWRDVEIPESVWRYILMCRATIKGEEAAQGSQAEFWREWLATKAENRTLGYEVAKAIREHVLKVERENVQLKEKMNDYDDIRSVLIELGWKEPDKETWLSALRVQSKLKTLQQIVPPHVLRQMKDAETSLRSLHEYITAEQSA